MPTDWRLMPLKYIATFSGGGTPGRERPDFWNGGIPWVSPKDMKTEVIVSAEESVTEAGVQHSSTSIQPPDSLLLVVRSGILQHTIPVAINKVPVALNQDMKALYFNKALCLPRFAFRWIQGFNEQLLLAWRKAGATVESIEQQYLAQTIVPLPSLPEQAAIAAFLDRETAKIDELVEEQKRLIDLLKEKRQAVISHAVTKGLNPHAPMKDTGIEWLGEVPEHWELIPTKRLTSLITSGPRGWSEQTGEHGSIFFQSQNIGRLMETSFAECTRVTVDMTADAERAQLMAGDVVVCITGARTSAVAHVTELHETAFVNQHVCLVRPAHIQGRFLAYAIFSVSGQVQLQLAMYGLKQGLSLQDVRDIVVPVPPLSEAIAITGQLDQFTNRIDLAIREAEQSITLLRERRTALISAAVTGKIDLRDTAEVHEAAA
nr:restriction endonuclease subunit S [Aquibium carbonis]